MHIKLFLQFFLGHYKEQKSKLHRKFMRFVLEIQVKTRISQFLAYTLAIFTEYIAWATFGVVLVPITTHIPSFINVAHTELWIFDFFVISQSEQICK